MRSLILLVLVSSLCACGGRALPPLREPTAVGAPGTLTTTLFWDPDASWSVHRAYLAIDGALVPWSASIVAAPGDHTVAVRIDLELGCETLHVRSTQGLVMGTTAAALGVELVETDDDRPLDERLHVRWSTSGATLGYHATAYMPEICAQLDALHRNVCLVDEGVRSARVQKDIIKLHCTHDKSKQIHALLPRAELGDPLAVQAIERLAKEAAQCVGEELAYLPATQVTREDHCH